MMPVSESVKRAMAETEQTLKQLGYKVVPFFLTNEVWDNARDYMMAILATGMM